MADGNTVSGSRNGHSWNWHVYANAYIVSQTATQATVRCDVGYWTKWAIDVYAKGSMWGAASASWTGSFQNSTQSPKSAVIMTKDVTVAKGSSAQTVTFGASAQTTGGFAPGTSSVSASCTVGAIDYSAPAAPSSCAATRNSDSKVTVTWQNGSTSATAPRGGTVVERKTDGGSWVQLATASADAVNYADASVSANHRYAYRVRATGAGGGSAYSESGDVYTSPAAPESVSLSKVSDTAVSIDITGKARWADSYEVQVSLNGGVWASAGTTGSWPYRHTPGGGTVRYRVRAKVGSLASEWTESDSIATITPPLAPSLNATESVYATGSTASLSWKPNHPDGSAQSAAQVEVAYGSTVTVHDVTEGSVFGLELPDAGTVTWRVRTKGLDPDWGAWSAKATFKVADTPQATITSPNVNSYVLDMLPLHVAWGVTSPDGVSSQTLELVQSGHTVYTANLSGSARSLDIGASRYVFENGARYTIRLTVWSGSSLSTVATRTFSVAYVGPDESEAYLSVGGDLTVSVLVRYGTAEGSEETVDASVTRVSPDGTQEVIAESVKNAHTALDRLPPLNADYSYIVTSYSASGSATSVTVPARVDSGGAEAFNFGADGGTCVRLGYNAEASSSIAYGGETFHFARGASAPHLPEFYPDGDLDVTGTHSYAVIDQAEYMRLLGLVRDPSNAVCWYRSAWGGRYRVKADWSLSYSASAYSLWNVSAALTEVVWEAPRV